MPYINGISTTINMLLADIVVSNIIIKINFMQ